MTENIISAANPKIKNTVKLIRSASYRRQSSLFVIEGLRLCFDAMQSGIVLRELYFSAAAESKCEPLIAAADNAYSVSDAVVGKLADTKSSQGVFAVCEIPRNEISFDPDGVYIASDEIQDPSNLGALCRTAEALGLSGVIIGGGCDIFNPKALRASMGAFFRLPCMAAASLCEVLPDLKAGGFELLASVPDRSALSISSLEKRNGVVCVVGNEGSGISEPVLSMCDRRVTIPMRGRAESLNAAAAASILMWELVR